MQQVQAPGLQDWLTQHIHRKGFFTSAFMPIEHTQWWHFPTWLRNSPDLIWPIRMITLRSNPEYWVLSMEARVPFLQSLVWPSWGSNPNPTSIFKIRLVLHRSLWGNVLFGPMGCSATGPWVITEKIELSIILRSAHNFFGRVLRGAPGDFTRCALTWGQGVLGGGV